MFGNKIKKNITKQQYPKSLLDYTCVFVIFEMIKEIVVVQWTITE